MSIVLLGETDFGSGNYNSKSNKKIITMSEEFDSMQGRLIGFMKSAMCVNKLLKDDAIKIINKVLAILPNNECDFSVDDSLDGITIVYTGGRHPEYASNVFSCVELVYSKDNVVYVDSEDGTTELRECDAFECYDIAMYLLAYKQHLDDGVIDKETPQDAE